MSAQFRDLPRPSSPSSPSPVAAPLLPTLAQGSRMDRNLRPVLLLAASEVSIAAATVIAFECLALSWADRTRMPSPSSCPSVLFGGFCAHFAMQIEMLLWRLNVLPAAFLVLYLLFPLPRSTSHADHSAAPLLPPSTPLPDPGADLSRLIPSPLEE